MRVLKFFALVSIFLISSISWAGQFHQISSLDDDSNYVVIGAFAVKQNAVRFTARARASDFDAHFMMNRHRNLYYVYVMNTDDRAQAVSEAMRLRVETEFADAWVFGGSLEKQKAGDDFSPENGGLVQEVTTADERVMPARETAPEEQAPEASVAETKDAEAGVSVAVVEEVSSEEDEALNGKQFLFRLYRASDRMPVEGDVNVIDLDRARKMGTYKGNEAVRIHSPGSNSDSISFVCEVFGYRKVQLNIDYDDPIPEGQESSKIFTEGDGNITVVPFELTRLRKGDIAVMYNVYFYKDAGVMRPESKWEVNSLREMLKENPKYKIRIHGHTNGGAPGKIISMEEESKNFFSLNDTKDGYGSAKKLSHERADVIRRYLIDQGVDPKRMEVKAWGGKRPIHDKLSNRAGENVRVEVEILEDS